MRWTRTYETATFGGKQLTYRTIDFPGFCIVRADRVYCVIDETTDTLCSFRTKLTEAKDLLILLALR
jgi:hypothetical protein